MMDATNRMTEAETIEWATDAMLAIYEMPGRETDEDRRAGAARKAAEYAKANRIADEDRLVRWVNRNTSWVRIGVAIDRDADRRLVNRMTVVLRNRRGN